MIASADISLQHELCIVRYGCSNAKDCISSSWVELEHTENINSYAVCSIIAMSILQQMIPYIQKNSQFFEFSTLTKIS